MSTSSRKMAPRSNFKLCPFVAAAPAFARFANPVLRDLLLLLSLLSSQCSLPLPEALSLAHVVTPQHTAGRALATNMPSHTHTPQVRSVLLDMDDRLAQFYAHDNDRKRRTLYKFNMSNGSFLGDAGGGGTAEENEAQLRAVFGKADCVLFDPPFGLRVELLANTLRLITNARRAANAADAADAKGGKGAKGLAVMLFLPHFMSARVKLELPSLEMLDFPIEYQVSASEDRHVESSRHPNYCPTAQQPGSPAAGRSDLRSTTAHNTTTPARSHTTPTSRTIPSTRNG